MKKKGEQNQMRFNINTKTDKIFHIKFSKYI